MAHKRGLEFFGFVFTATGGGGGRFSARNIFSKVEYTLLGASYRSLTNAMILSTSFFFRKLTVGKACFKISNLVRWFSSVVSLIVPNHRASKLRVFNNNIFFSGPFFLYGQKIRSGNTGAFKRTAKLYREPKKKKQEITFYFNFNRSEELPKNNKTP